MTIHTHYEAQLNKSGTFVFDDSELQTTEGIELVRQRIREHFISSILYDDTGKVRITFSTEEKLITK